MKINYCRLFIVLFSITWNIPCFAGEKSPSPAGYYETEPGSVGQTNRLCISADKSDTYQVEIATVYCATTFSGDCANAEFGNVTFLAKLKNGKFRSHEKDTGCYIDIDFKHGNAFVIQRIGTCKDDLPHSDAGGLYLKKKAIADERACSP